jgi:hypothetical protein
MFNDNIKTALIAGKKVIINFNDNESVIELDTSLSTIEYDLRTEINMYDILNIEYKILD